MPKVYEGMVAAEQPVVRLTSDAVLNLPGEAGMH